MSQSGERPLMGHKRPWTGRDSHVGCPPHANGIT